MPWLWTFSNDINVSLSTGDSAGLVANMTVSIFFLNFLPKCTVRKIIIDPCWNGLPFYGSFFLTHFFVTLVVFLGHCRAGTPIYDSSSWLRFYSIWHHPLIVILYFFHFLKLNTKCCYPLTKPFLNGLRAHSLHFCAGLQSRPSHPLTYLWSKDVRNMMLERKKLIPWRNVLHITSRELYVVICSQVESWSSCKWLTQLINGSQNSGWVIGKPILISLNGEQIML